MTRFRTAISVALLRRLTADHRCVGRLRQNDLYLRSLLRQNATDTFQRPARPEPRHPIIETLTREIVDDLSRRRLRVVIRIRLVLELPRQEPAILLRELVDLLYHTGCALGRRRENHLGSEETHQFSPLDAERFRYRHHSRVAFRRADQP